MSLLRSSSDASSRSSMISCSERRYARAIASSICARSATAIRKLEPSAKRRSSAVARFVGSVTARRGVPSSRMRSGSASYRRASSSGSRATACLSSSATSRSTNSSSYCSASAPAIARSVVKPRETAISPRRRPEEAFSSSTRRSCSSVRMRPSTSNWPSGIHPSPGSGVLMRSLSAGAPRSWTRSSSSAPRTCRAWRRWQPRRGRTGSRRRRSTPRSRSARPAASRRRCRPESRR